MKCRIVFSGSFSRIYSASPYSMVNLCSTYQSFPEALSCFLTHKDSEDETHWYLLWRRVSAETVIYTRDLPPQLLDLREKVKAERKLISGGKESVIPQAWKNYVEWLQAELTPPPGTTSRTFGVTTVDGNLQEVRDSHTDALSNSQPPPIPECRVNHGNDDVDTRLSVELVLGRLVVELKKLQEQWREEEGVEGITNEEIDNILKRVAAPYLPKCQG